MSLHLLLLDQANDASQSVANLLAQMSLFRPDLVQYLPVSVRSRRE